jgi:hypothetical protein
MKYWDVFKTPQIKNRQTIKKRVIIFYIMRKASEDNNNFSWQKSRNSKAYSIGHAIGPDFVGCPNSG